MRLWLIRHTPVNLPEGYCYGRADLELSPEWRSHFAAARAKLPNPARERAVVYSSPLRRCLDLASSLSDQVLTDERLLELDFGSWELRRWEDIPRAELDAWTRDVFRAAPPGGESLRSLHERCGEFLEELLAGPRAMAVIVTHGGVIRSLLARLLGLPPANAFRLRIDYGGVSQVRVGRESVQIDYINR